jgi:hypothetical protein
MKSNRKVFTQAAPDYFVRLWIDFSATPFYLISPAQFAEVDMALEPCQQKLLSTWIIEKEIRRDCPSCSSTEDFIACDLVELIIKPGSEGTSGTEIPVIPVICPRCGHVRLFSANAIGIDG